MGLSVQEKKFKIDFQGSNCGGHRVFPIRTIFAIFDLQVTLMSFQSNALSVQEKKGKIDFQDSSHGGHLGFLVERILAILILKSH